MRGMLQNLNKLIESKTAIKSIQIGTCVKSSYSDLDDTIIIHNINPNKSICLISDSNIKLVDLQSNIINIRWNEEYDSPIQWKVIEFD